MSPDPLFRIALRPVAACLLSVLTPELTAAAQSTAIAVPSAAAPSPAPGTVTISLADYDRLLDRAATRPGPPVPAPARAVVARAELALRVDDAIARGVITLQGDVLHHGPTAVPILAGGTILDARAGGQMVPIVVDQKGYQAILPGGGPFPLSITWAAPVTSEPGRAWVQLPAIGAGSVRATIDTPGENPDVRIDAGLITSRTSAAGRGLVDAILHPAAPGRVSWSSREAPAAAPVRALRLLSDVKTLVTMSEGEVRLASLFDVTVVQGTTPTLHVRVPDGFEVLSVSGSTIDTRSAGPGRVELTVTDTERRRHQFLVALERSTADRPAAGDIALPWIAEAQRESGEMAVEAVGALELGVAERASLTRIDAAELTPTLKSLAREPILAAYRYQRRTTEPMLLTLSATRFPDARVLTAAAERAVATTLVTREGRALTEVTLTVRNQAHTFLKVGLPQGAEILSAEVAGQPVKPVHGSDGLRVPLLRSGLDTRAAYVVSFVYLHAPAPLGRKGQARLVLARLDVPVGWLEWEVFMPEHLVASGFEGPVFGIALVAPELDARRGAGTDVAVGAVAETVTVEAVPAHRELVVPAPQASTNVLNLQRRAAGVLPVRIDVPRAGRSHMFVRPLIVDDETTLTFRYRAGRHRDR
jgi:hypothetical protein